MRDALNDTAHARIPMYVLPVGIANMVGEYRVQSNELMAAAVMATLPVMALYAPLERHLVDAITVEAVKG
ncbi:MAG: hypothetical protein ABI552_08675 [Casimicrobiaceae bacterium]